MLREALKISSPLALVSREVPRFHGGSLWHSTPGSIPTRSGVIFCFKFCNPNLHNISRSDRIRFKTKNPIER